MSNWEIITGPACGRQVSWVNVFPQPTQMGADLFDELPQAGAGSAEAKFPFKNEKKPQDTPAACLYNWQILILNGIELKAFGVRAGDAG